MNKLLTLLLLGMSPALFAAENNQMSEIVDSVQAVCQAPSKKGEYWDIKVTGEADAKVNLKLTKAGIKGAATFTKKEWDGVQQVLQEHQSGDNKDYRDCAKTLTPIFLEKFAGKTTPTSKASTKTPAVKEPTEPKRKETNNSTQSTEGDTSPIINNVKDSQITVNSGNK